MMGYRLVQLLKQVLSLISLLGVAAVLSLEGIYPPPRNVVLIHFITVSVTTLIIITRVVAAQAIFQL